MRSPRPHAREAGGEARGDAQGTDRTRHKTLPETRPHGSEQQSPHTHPHIKRHENDDTIRAHITHAFLPSVSDHVVPGFGRVVFFFFGIAQHAHMTQDSSCPGLKDELQKHKCSRSFFKEDPFSQPSLGIPFLHSHLSLLSIRSLKKHCG